MEVRLLGEVAFSVEGSPITVNGARQRLLLAALALRPGEVVTADRLADVIWGDDPPAKVTNALQAQVSALRRVLPPDTLVTRPAGYALSVADRDVDVRVFEQLAARGRALLADGRTSEAAVPLRAALELWGEPFAGLDTDAFRVDQARLDELHLSTVEAHVETDLAIGRHDEVVADLEALTRQHPLRERFWVQRMIALYRSGRQADALRAYSEARTLLIDELGIEPGPELRRTEAAVLAHDPALDLDLDTATTPARAQHPTRGNLRARLTTFVGRDHEVAQLAEALAESRLVTLVGPGGAGKTRLAIETADVVAPRFVDGVWIVELAAVGDASGVAPAVAITLGVTDSSTLRPADRATDQVEQIVRFLTGRELLIVIDNCEHLVGESAAVCERLLAAVPGLRILATSREALGVPGEALRPLSPLPSRDAVALFIDRAHAVAPALVIERELRDAITDICRRLDGLPLAIELAAARLRSLSVFDLAGRLDDRFRILTGGARTALPRQQTLRAVVDWSYDLLFDDERRLLWRLAVFSDGARLGAAEAVCGDEALLPDEILELLGRLVDKSLVVLAIDDDGQARYRQLQTLWQYAREKLAESGEGDEIRARHAAWFLDIARATEEHLHGPEGPTWRRRVTAEVADLRAALDWFITEGDGVSACELATGVAWLWFLRGEFGEAVRWLSDAVAVPFEGPPATHAHADAWRSYYVAILEGGGRTVDDGAAALEIARRHGTPMQLGGAGLLHMSTLTRVGRHEEALSFVPEAANALREADNPWGLAMVDLLLANNYARLGRLDDAAVHAALSVEQFEEVGEHWSLIEPLGLLTAIADLRDEPDVFDRYDRAVERCRASDLPGYLAMWLLWRGMARFRRGDLRAARVDMVEGVEVSPNPATTAQGLMALARVDAHLGSPAAGLDGLRRARSLFASIARADGEAAVVVAEGLATLELGDHRGASRLVAVAETLDAAMAGILSAAIALWEGDTPTARARLTEWGDRHLPATPGAFATALSTDHARLLAACTA